MGVQLSKQVFKPSVLGIQAKPAEKAESAVRELFDGEPVRIAEIAHKLQLADAQAYGWVHYAVKAGTIKVTGSKKGARYYPVGNVIDSRSCAEKAADAVRELFCGSPVKRAAIAKELGISNTIAGHSIQKAFKQGLIEKTGNVGHTSGWIPKNGEQNGSCRKQDQAKRKAKTE